MRTLYLFIAFIAFGIVIVILNKFTIKHKKKDVKASNNPNNDAQRVQKTPERIIPEGCCGAHEVCEKESLITTKKDVIYFSDEELDAYKGRTPDSYTDEEIDEFEDVLLTLRESETAEWLKSLQLRGIEMPETIKDQALLMVAERRNKHE
ncbi:MAG: phospholipase [Bacteroidia bacterium]|nr:phospholipase [Bacteroidia bacterium]